MNLYDVLEMFKDVSAEDAKKHTLEINLEDMRQFIEKAKTRVAELEGQLRDMRILGGKTLAERNDALARVAELEAVLQRVKHGAEYCDELGDLIDAVLSKGRAQE